MLKDAACLVASIAVFFLYIWLLCLVSAMVTEILDIGPSTICKWLIADYGISLRVLGLLVINAVWTACVFAFGIRTGVDFWMKFTNKNCA